MRKLSEKLKSFIKDIVDGPGAFNPTDANKVLAVNSDGTKVEYTDSPIVKNITVTNDAIIQNDLTVQNDATFNNNVNFNSTGRINWSKITADTVTLVVGTSSETVAELRTAHDGTFYHITEVAAAPAQNLIVDFISVTAFNWVQVIAMYDGSGTHAVAIQLYNWTQTRWDSFEALQNGQEDVTTADGYILDGHSFFVPNDTEYIGTGGNAGEARVRFYHTMTGNNSHDTYIDVCALYQ